MSNVLYRKFGNSIVLGTYASEEIKQPDDFVSMTGATLPKEGYNLCTDKYGGTDPHLEALLEDAKYDLEQHKMEIDNEARENLHKHEGLARRIIHIEHLITNLREE